MSYSENIKITENNKNASPNTETVKRFSPEKFEDKKEEEVVQDSQNVVNSDKKSLKPLYIALIVLGIVVVIAIIIIVVVVVVKKNKKDENEPIIPEIIEKNYIKTTMKENFEIPSDNKIQVVGANFQFKLNAVILGKNGKKFTIGNDGKIEGVTKDDFPLSYYFNESITNGSYLFKDVKCFKTIDLSRMDGSQLVDISNMFENSDFEEIYFGTESEPNNNQLRYLEEGMDFPEEGIEEEEEDEEEIEEEEEKKYFYTPQIKSASNLFNNCANLKKVQLSPYFNVGRNAKGMFKGCKKLEEVNTKSISSTEIEEMESMFEDCSSLREISFSNDFLTGEIKTLINVFTNTLLNILDISYFRLYNLQSSTDIFKGASISGTLKLGKYYSNDNIRDNIFKEISKITDPSTHVYTPSGTNINTVFENIYSNERGVRITVTTIDIDYNINYKEDANYRLYSNKLHFGLGWDFNLNNTYDLDSSVVTFDYKYKYLSNVYYAHLTEYGGAINLNGDDLTGEGEGDDEEIRVSLDLLPSNVQMFTVQLNSYKGNSLKNVESAYIRISTDSEVIGTYSITQAGDNIGLLIGCFFKKTTNNSDEWYFKPLNEVIPGNQVTESVTAIQEILHLIFDNKMISTTEFISRLKWVADGLSVYSQRQKYNSLYWNGTHWFADCSNLIKSIINGRDVYTPKRGSYQKKFPVVGDVNANNLILKCNNISTDFNELQYGVPRLLHLKDNQGNGHVGVYLGQNVYSSNGYANVIEATTSWGANAIIYSWVDSDGTRRRYQGGPLSEMKYNWSSHGSLDQWLW